MKIIWKSDYYPLPLRPKTFYHETANRKPQTANRKPQTINTWFGNPLRISLITITWIFLTQHSFSQCNSYPIQIGSGSIPAVPLASQILPPLINGGIINAQNFVINGTLTVDIPLTIRACNVYLDGGATIIVLPGNSLTIEQGSHLGSCLGTGAMWEGIQFDGDAQNGGSQVIINSGSIIEDAIVAVHLMDDASSLSYVLIDHAQFNRNFRNIWFENTGPYINNQNVISDCSFTCQNNGVNGMVLHAPHIHERTFRAIEFDHSFGSIASNTPILIGPGNVIDFAETGIYCNQSFISSEYNTFSSCPTGVHGLFDTFLYVNHCDFFECGTGIFCESIVEILEAAYNRFLNNNIGIDYQSGLLFHCDIQHNDFTGFFQFGIHAMDNNQNSTYNNLLNITNNHFAATSLGNAIFVAEPVSASTYSVAIEGNIIQDVGRGIFISQLIRPLVRMNVISVDYNPQQNPLPVTFGINAVSCDGARIVLNTVDCSNPDNACNQFSSGIIIENSNAVYLNCNEVSHVGQGLSFGVTTQACYIMQNTMGEIQRQLFLFSNPDGLGNVGNTTTAMDNQWLNLPAGCTGNNTFSDHSNLFTGFTNFFVKNSTSYVPLNNDNVAGGNCTYIIISPSVTFPLCSETGGGDQTALRNAIATDSLYIDPGFENYRWLSKNYFIKDLNADTVSNTNPLWQWQYDSLLQENVGYLSQLADSIARIQPGDSMTIDHFESTLYSFSTSNLLEQNLKKAFIIYLHGKQDGWRNLNAADIDTLRNFSMRCVVTDGPAVYTAQILLTAIDSSVHFSIGCNQGYSPGYYRKDVHLEETNSIYPNPAQDEIFITGSMTEKAEKLELYNLFGQLVCRFFVSVHHEFNRISLNGLSGGVYFYVIKGNNNQIFDSGKFTKLN